MANVKIIADSSVCLSKELIKKYGIGLALLPIIIWLFGGSGGLIAYSVVLAIFCLVGSFTGIKRAVTTRQGLILDREYHFWQAKKRK